jgi:hypothetical protein
MSSARAAGAVVPGASTGEDLTSVTLAQIILENERSRRAGLPTAFLHQLIKHGEGWQDFVQKSLKSSLEGVMTSQREADRVFREWGAGPRKSPRCASSSRRSKSGWKSGARVKKRGPDPPGRDPENLDHFSVEEGWSIFRRAASRQASRSVPAGGSMETQHAPL